MKRKKKEKVILCISILMLLAVIAIVIGLSSTNALFSNRDTSTRRNNYNTGILSITAVSKTDKISLNHTLPMTDEEGEKQKPYIFTIRNNGNVDYEFDVQLLSTDNGNIFDPQYIKIKVDDDEIITLDELQDSRIKTKLTLSAGETKDISLRIWLADDTPNTQIGKSFTSELVINGIAVSPTTNYGTSASSYIVNLYNNADKIEVENNNIKYNYATSVSLMNDRLGGTTRDLNAGNIRYYGKNPNNYIDIGHKIINLTEVANWEDSGLAFATTNECLEWAKQNKTVANEYLLQYNYQTVSEFCSVKEKTTSKTILYRIIGVFDNMLKVIAVDSIGNYSWDTSSSSENNGNGINEWKQADLMKLLNPGYENESINNSLYWNSQSGTCYSGKNNSTTKCDFNNIGLTDTVKNKIATVTWHQNSFDANELYPNISYINERENTWTGKVGLIYPSDYGYATDLNICKNNTINKYNQEECNINNWLSIDSKSYWTISSNDSYVWNITNNANTSLDSSDASNGENAIYPVFYLNSEESIATGDGTIEHPYVLR